MKRLWNQLAHLIRSDEGPTAVQYALLLLLAFLTCLTLITAAGERSAVVTYPPDAPVHSSPVPSF